MEKRTELEILNQLVKFYCNKTEIEHLGILCRKADYRNEGVMQYIRYLKSKYNL